MCIAYCTCCCQTTDQQHISPITFKRGVYLCYICNNHVEYNTEHISVFDCHPPRVPDSSANRICLYFLSGVTFTADHWRLWQERLTMYFEWSHGYFPQSQCIVTSRVHKKSTEHKEEVRSIVARCSLSICYIVYFRDRNMKEKYS